jgi:hypothetical protein
MMDHIMGGGMMWGMGLLGLLVIIVLVSRGRSASEVPVLQQKPLIREIFAVAVQSSPCEKDPMGIIDCPG